jgi:hypothetical protein
MAHTLTAHTQPCTSCGTARKDARLYPTLSRQHWSSYICKGCLFCSLKLKVREPMRQVFPIAGREAHVHKQNLSPALIQPARPPSIERSAGSVPSGHTTLEACRQKACPHSLTNCLVRHAI